MVETLGELTRLGGVLVQRLTHDLAGVVGALGAALEMADDPEAAEIARDAARLLSCRLRLSRATWDPVAAPLPAATLREMLPALPGAARLRLRLDPALVAVAPGRVATTLSALTVAAEALPRGGSVDVSADLSIRIDGPGAAWPPGFADMLAEPEAARLALLAAEPRTVAAAICAAFAHRDAVRASVTGTRGLSLHRP